MSARERIRPHHDVSLGYAYVHSSGKFIVSVPVLFCILRWSFLFFFLEDGGLVCQRLALRPPFPLLIPHKRCEKRKRQLVMEEIVNMKN